MKQHYQRLWKQTLAWLLVVTVTFTSVDLTAFATVIENAESTVAENEVTSTATYMEDTEITESETVVEANVTEKTERMTILSVDDEEKILYEEETARTEATKTFRLNNGNYMVAQYGKPIHYQDGEGQWKEISMLLVEDGEEYTTGKDDGRTARVRFSKKLKEGKTVSIKHTEYPVSWGLSGAENKTMVLVHTETGEKKGNERFLVLEGLSQKVTYENVYEGVDVEYILQSETIKENIILKEKGTLSEFRAVYDIGKLEPLQKDSSRISLMDGEKEIYQIVAPYMEDKAGEQSHAITLSYEQTKNQEIVVMLSVDKEWLEEEERVYPVTIDPYILTETTRDDIDTTFITKDVPNANYSEKLELLVGRESSEYGLCRTLVKINLPSLNPGDMVVGAKLRLYLYKSDFYASSTPDLPINAYRVTGSWNASTVTWNTAPGYDSTVLDYAYINRQSSSDAAVAKIFDITKAVKAWHEGTAANHGIILTSAKESGTYAQTGVKGYFWPERYNTISDAYPLIQITYRNNKGLEDYWSCTGLDVGSAGVAYINDYTGNLVFMHGDVSTTGEILPASLQHIYNGYMHKKEFSSNYPKTGYGWKLSYQQTLLSSSVYGLTGDALSDFPYAYEDGDGTVHYFYKKTENGTTKYMDEDGLGLELTVSGTTKTITDKKNNRLVFDSYGNLTTVKDASGNQITITYTTSGGKRLIGTIRDGAGHIITLASSGNKLSQITDPAGRVTQFLYSSASSTVADGGAPGAGYLVQIKYPDGNSCHYAYDSDGALVKVTGKDGRGIEFTYTTEEKGKRLSKALEFGTDGSSGQTIGFFREHVNQTKLRTAGSDDVYGNSDDLITTMTFDNYGRTRGTITSPQNIENQEQGGLVYSYSAGSGAVSENIKALNRVTSEAYSGRNIRNYLVDHGAELASGWTGGSWDGNTTSYTVKRTGTEKLFGQYSLQIGMSAIPSVGGACYVQTVSTADVVPGKTYTLSGYVKVSDIQSTYGSRNGAGLVFRVTKADGSKINYYSEFIKGTSLVDINNGWKRLSVTVTIPADATELKACLVVQKAKGTAWFDGLQLEEGGAVNPYNLLENAFLETAGTSNIPKNWSASNLASTDGTYVFDSDTWGNSIRLVGDITSNKRIYQAVPVSGTEGDVYVASCWAKADAVADTDSRGSDYSILIKVHYSDNTSVIKEQKGEFNHDYTGWQKATVAFDLSDGTNTEKIPVKIEYSLCYYKQANVAYFDNAQLVKDIWGSYTYDEEGNLITAAENGEMTDRFTYDSRDDLIQVQDAQNRLYEYTYNDRHQVTEALAPAGQKVQFGYNSTGSILSAAVSNNDGTQKLRSLYEYTLAEDGISAGAYLAKVTDDMGYSTTYERDIQSGQLQSTSAPNGTVTSYIYETGTNLLAGVVSGNTSVSYTYNSKNTHLDEIGHNGMAYSFEYDAFGNLVRTRAGDSVLRTDSYAPGNGKMTGSVYGNSDTLGYEYDSAGNLVSVSVNGNKEDEWIYDASQILTGYKDKECGREHFYRYDITGRLSDVNVRYLDDGSTVFKAEYGYNNVDELTRKRTTGGEKYITCVYGYNDNGQLSSMSYGYYSQDYTYDMLGRLHKRTVNLTNPIRYDYIYDLSGQESENGIIFHSSRLGKEYLGDIVYLYSYDSMGNIIAVTEADRVSESGTDTENSRVVATYEYDSFGRLVRENNASLNRTITYAYDDGGNLTIKKVYAYTTAVSLAEVTPEDSIVCTYDNDWTDLMTAYDGQSITYDTIGNPISYRGKTLEWEGRQMVSLTGNSLGLSCTYDADGIRTTKTVNGELREYYYSDGKLCFEKRGSDEFYYTYDTYGNLAGINYYPNGSNLQTYHVVVNSRGDIEAIHNVEGALVARYRYDAWGKTISVQDADGNEITDVEHIGQLNLLRYRGYYYDAETGFYYLGSRYYDPEVGRFINADTTDVLTLNPASLSEKNLYAYCNNNPINKYDINGNFAVAAIGWTAIDVTISLVSMWISAKAMGEKLSAKDVVVTAVVTAIGSMNILGDITIALWNGIYAGCNADSAGYDATTSLLIFGVTALGTLIGMNALISRHISDAGNLANAAIAATIGLGDELATTAAVKTIEQNGKPKKATWSNMRSRTKNYYNSSNLNYIKVKNGRLMK